MRFARGYRERAQETCVQRPFTADSRKSVPGEVAARFTRLGSMSRQYLDVPYRSKDAAKALGARFDGSVKRWYIDPGINLEAFAAWLPMGVTSAQAAVGIALAAADGSREVAAIGKGISLSRLLNGVSTAIAEAFATGVWTLVEVNEVTVRNGHVYLDLSERDSNGQLVAKARATIWASVASRILPDFERATGAMISAGIKLLVRAKPVFKSQFGFSLEIDAIDAEYTLGDLEARKNEIRARLQREGVFERNRSLPPPWDYRLVLVVAPQDAAGLGDFQKEAERLGRFGLCRFVYAHSRFQGEGAAGEIVAATRAALTALGVAESVDSAVASSRPCASADGRVSANSVQPDAIVLIRGGGAVNDLAWLNDYALARFICDQTIPVLTGIGHQRDSTIPDEVAAVRFDTPSKVIAGIEQQIQRRAQEARTAWELVLGASARGARNARLALERGDAQIQSDAHDHVARARQVSTAALNLVGSHAVAQVHEAARTSLALLHQVRAGTDRDIAAARQRVPHWMNAIRIEALASVGRARATTAVEHNAVLDRSTAAVRRSAQTVDIRLQQVGERALAQAERGRSNAQALMREIAGQGPDKTLARGFAIVRLEDGQPVTTSAMAQGARTLHIEFKDGAAVVRPLEHIPSRRK